MHTTTTPIADTAAPCDPEDACMHEAGTSAGCCDLATRFHPRPGEWCDEILCDAHAAGKVTTPLTPPAPSPTTPAR